MGRFLLHPCASESVVLEPDALVSLSIVLHDRGRSMISSQRGSTEHICTEGPQTSGVRRQASAPIFATVVAALASSVVLSSRPVFIARAATSHGPSAGRGFISCGGWSQPLPWWASRCSLHGPVAVTGLRIHVEPNALGLELSFPAVGMPNSPPARRRLRQGVSEGVDGASFPPELLAQGQL
jgi:hypothetical protein